MTNTLGDLSNAVSAAETKAFTKFCFPSIWPSTSSRNDLSLDLSLGPGRKKKFEIFKYLRIEVRISPSAPRPPSPKRCPPSPVVITTAKNIVYNNDL